MEREITLNPFVIASCNRICFVLPKDGNDYEYVAINEGDREFEAILDIACRVAADIVKEREKDEQDKEKEARYQMYLELKDEFEHN
jgi:hypothetical protein